MRKLALVAPIAAAVALLASSVGAESNNKKATTLSNALRAQCSGW